MEISASQGDGTGQQLTTYQQPGENELDTHRGSQCSWTGPQIWEPHENVPTSLGAVSELCRKCPYTCSSMLGRMSSPSPFNHSQHPRARICCSGERHSPCVIPVFFCSTASLGMRSLDLDWRNFATEPGRKSKGPKAFLQENCCSSVCGAEQRGCSDLPACSRQLCLAGTNATNPFPEQQ